MTTTTQRVAATEAAVDRLLKPNVGSELAGPMAAPQAHLEPVSHMWVTKFLRTHGLVHDNPKLVILKSFPTIAVGAQWVTSADQPEERIYNITKALWNDNSRKLLDVGHAKGKAIQKASAVAGAGIPFHPGAEKFYREKGLIK